FRAPLSTRLHWFRRAKTRCRTQPRAPRSIVDVGSRCTSSCGGARTVCARRFVTLIGAKVERAVDHTCVVRRQHTRHTRLFRAPQLQRQHVGPSAERTDAMSDALSLLLLPFVASVA